MSANAPPMTPLRGDDPFNLPLPLPLRMAAGFAQEEGLVTGCGDLPPAPAQRELDTAAWLRWASAVYARLDELGAIAGYRAYVASRSNPARCPPWCEGQHPDVNDGRGISHNGPSFTAAVSIDGRPNEATTELHQAEADTGEMLEVGILLRMEEGVLTAEGARKVAALLQDAADALDAATGAEDSLPTLVSD